VVNVASVSQLVNAVNSAVSGTTILVADGTYNLNGEYLQLDVGNVTLRSASGNREAVILDGNYQTTEIIQVAAPNVTIADLTLREAYYHPIHVMSGSSANTDHALIYNVHIIDPGEQAIKINPVAGGYYTDDGVVACSQIELTDAGRTHIRNNCYTGGVDAHQSRGWVVRDNTIEGFWCAAGLSEHAVHFWKASRDTRVERNLLRNNARGVGFGMSTSGTGRTYADALCPTATGYVDHYGGLIRNNMVFAGQSGLFASEYGFDCGVCLWNACGARAAHNTVYSTNLGQTFSAMEWRFANTRAEILNNLVNAPLRERDGATAVQSGNVLSAQAGWFVNAAAGNLHLAPMAASVIDRVAALADVTDDIDADPRPTGAAADAGADEYVSPAPAAVTDLRVSQAITAAGTLTVTLVWTPPVGAVTTTVRAGAQPIDEAGWAGAPALTTTLRTGDVTAPVAPAGETTYFALKTQNAAGNWSGLSNFAFWPHRDVWLPAVRR
jgi:hypothetical protein